MAIRLRQVALVARDLHPVVEDLAHAYDLEVCFTDPGVAEFGLTNALVAAGQDFLEVVQPVTEGTTAERLLRKRGGDGGYMVIVQCDDLERRRARLADLGVRVVWRIDLPEIAGTHLHPRDVGGAILSIDATTDWDQWQWAGPTWQDHVRTSVVSGLAGVEVAADDPEAMAARWAEVLDVPLDGTVARLDGSEVRFVPAGARGEGLDGVLLRATDQGRAGEQREIGGVRFTLV
jgi:hypothetical protein